MLPRRLIPSRESSFFGLLRTYQIPKRIVDLLTNLHEGTKCRVRVSGKLSDAFITASGVQQLNFAATESAQCTECKSAKCALRDFILCQGGCLAHEVSRNGVAP